MKNPYDRTIQEDIDNCRLLSEGQTVEECCEQKGIENCPKDPVMLRAEDQSYIPYFLPLMALFTLVALAVVSWKKTSEVRKIIASMHESAIARLSAWGIWAFVVITAVILFDPYRGYMSVDDKVDILMWIVLPPVAVFATTRWYKRFVKNEE
ncbi:MAG: hypothetical protein RH947_13035 [Alcanivorax sp.]